MAVPGLLSMLCVSPIQPDMDSCPDHSSGGTRNHLKFWQSGIGPRASSCLSSTMVDHNDPDDSGSSQPPTPTRSLVESRPQLAIRDSSLPGHELELSISLNDAQRSTPPRSKPLKDEFDLATREDTLGLGQSGTGLEEEASLSGPPRKRARMSPVVFRLEENQAGNTREQLPLRQHSLVSTSSAVTGAHSLMSSRSFPSFRSTEREPSPSPSRGASSGSKPPTSWWLGPGPRSSAMIPNEPQHFQSSQEPARANFGSDGRGMIPGTSLQELPFKAPSFYPNMLSSMETSEQFRRGEDGPSASGARQSEQVRPHAVLYESRDPFSRKDSSTSRISSASTVSEETVPRSGSTFYVRDREGVFQEASALGSPHSQQPLDVQGGRRRHATTSEFHQGGGLERESLQGGFPRPQQVEQRGLQQGDQRALPSPPGVNANTTFYARIRDAAQQSASSPFSEAGGGYAGSFNPGNLGFNLAGPLLPPRGASQTGSNALQFSGETANSNFVQQQANNEALRNLLAAHPSIGSIPPFMSPVAGPEPVRLSFPNLSSIDFVQSLQQRQSLPPQGTDRHRQSAPGLPQGFSFLGSTQESQRSLPVELNPSLPHGSQPGNFQAPQGLRDFLSPQVSKGPVPSSGLGRSPGAGPRGFGSSGLEIPTHLSLQATVAPPPLTVVMEGRSIGRRINLQDYGGYESFALAMRAMFNSQPSSQEPPADVGSCTLVTAIPGYVIAYEDEEGDVLLAGDLPWRDFVRMAKQIRIVSSSRISFKLSSGPPR